MVGNLGGAAVVGLMGLMENAQGNFSGAVTLTCVLAAISVGIALALPEPLAALSISE
jgi:hypothetical protein